ncbi:MAG: GxxExxY protein [Spirochaetes bacterium]|nr:GxxExxY protein [Spirochaetota bacterium]
MLHFQSITDKIIASAYEVHKTLGTGFLERVYRNALAHEISLAGMPVEIEKPIKVHYKDVIVGEYFADMFVNGLVIVETKCVERLAFPHIMQLKNYLNGTDFHVGLLINFGGVLVEHKRVFP